MNKLISSLILATSLSVPAYAYAFGWDDIEDAAEKAGSKIEEGWETVEDAVIPETEEERQEEAREHAEDAREERKEEAAKRRGEQPIVN